MRRREKPYLKSDRFRTDTETTMTPDDALSRINALQSELDDLRSTIEAMTDSEDDSEVPDSARIEVPLTEHQVREIETQMGGRPDTSTWMVLGQARLPDVFTSPKLRLVLLTGDRCDSAFTTLVDAAKAEVNDES